MRMFKCLVCGKTDEKDKAPSLKYKFPMFCTFCKTFTMQERVTDLRS